MSPSALAHAFLDAAARRDVDAMLGYMTTDVVMDEPQSGIHRGAEAVRRGMASWPRISNQKISRETVEGNVVKMQGTLDAEGYGTVSTEWKFTIAGDKITRLDVWGG